MAKDIAANVLKRQKGKGQMSQTVKKGKCPISGKCPKRQKGRGQIRSGKWSEANVTEPRYHVASFFVCQVKIGKKINKSPTRDD